MTPMMRPAFQQAAGDVVANTAGTANGCFKHDDDASTASLCPSTMNVSIIESSNALLEANSQTSDPVRPNHFEEFEYSFLPYDDSMRLLRLFPGSHDDKLYCELFAARVSERPLYESYFLCLGRCYQSGHIILQRQQKAPNYTEPCQRTPADAKAQRTKDTLGRWDLHLF
jgi:hypothetical protein